MKMHFSKSTEFLFYEISEYIFNINNILSDNLLFVYNKVFTYIFSSILLQCTGLLEKKFEVLKLLFALVNNEYRYDYSKNYQEISATYNNLYNFFCVLKDSCNCSIYSMHLKQFSIEIFSNENIKKDIYEKLCNFIDENLKLKSCFGRDYYYFKNLGHKYFCDNKLKEIYNCVYEKRHKIAHNLDSVYCNEDFYILSEKDNININKCAQLFSILLVDSKMIELARLFDIERIY